MAYKLHTKSFDVFPIVISRVPCIALQQLPVSPFLPLLSNDRSTDAMGTIQSIAGRELAMRVGNQLPLFGAEQRRALLDLRRQLFNGKVPREDLWKTSASLLDANLASDIHSWVSQCQDPADASTSEQWMSAVETSKSQLTNFCSSGPVAVAIGTHHPHLLARFIDTPNSNSRRPASRLARLHRTLWALVWRSALRPTPLGLYCSVGFGQFHSGLTTTDLDRRTLIDTGFVERTATLTRTLSSRHNVIIHVEVALTGRVPPDDFNSRTGWVTNDGYSVAMPVDPGVVQLLDLLSRNGGAMPGSSIVRGGISPREITDAVEGGWARLRWRGDGLDQRGQDPELLAQEITVAAFTDVVLLPLLRGTPCQPRTVTMSPKPMSIGNFESCADSRIETAVDVADEFRDGFVADAALWGGSLVEQMPTPARQATRVILETIFGGARTPLPDILHTLSKLVMGIGREPNYLSHPEHVAADLGLPLEATPNPFASFTAQALRSASPVLFAGEPANLVPTQEARRVAFLFRPIDQPTSPGSGLLTRLCSDRGSVLPRYLSAPSTASAQLAEQFALWLSQFPNLVDLDCGAALGIECRPRLTRRLVGPRAGVTTGDLTLNDVALEPSGAKDIAICDLTGAPIDPVYFGVQQPSKLPLAFQFLLAIGSPVRSQLELILESLNSAVVTMAHVEAPCLRLPAVWATPHLQLSSESALLKCASLAAFNRSDDRSMFLQFHRMTSRYGIPAGRVAVRAFGSTDTQVLDLRYPEGVALLARRAIKSLGPSLLVSSLPDPPMDSGNLRYCIEHGVEVRVGNTC